MGDAEVPRMQGLVSNSCSLCSGVKVCKEDQIRHVSTHCLVEDCGNRNSGVCEGQVVLK